MRGTMMIGLAMAFSMALAGAAQADSKLAWEQGGFNMPESVVLDAKRGWLYVSNIEGDPLQDDGKGSLSRITVDGKRVQHGWVTALSSPKGMDLLGDTLYVSDFSRIVAINVDTGAVTGRYPIEGVKFLNDVTIGADGTVYVSDMTRNAIYQLKDGQVSVWLESDKLDFPNGLLIQGDQMAVGSWGVITDGFSTKVPGHMMTVSMKDKSITPIGDGSSIGNLDGVEVDKNGNYIVTDWLNGGLMRITAQGEVTRLQALKQGSADLEVLADQNLAIVPMMLEGVVQAYTLD